MSTAGPAILSLLMITVFVMAGGAVHLIVTGKDRKRGVLMLIVAAVMLANVLILAL